MKILQTSEGSSSLTEHTVRDAVKYYRVSQKKRTFRIFKDMWRDQFFWFFLGILSKYHCSRHVRSFLVLLVILAHLLVHFGHPVLCIFYVKVGGYPHLR